MIRKQEILLFVSELCSKLSKSMLSGIWSFVKRHRRKFLFAGVLIGGAVVLGRYAQRKLLEYQDREAAEYLANFRRQHHFESNQRNCNTTVLSLLPRLRELLCRLLNSEELTSQLRARPSNKLELWEQLKILSFTRTITAVYSSTMLAVYLRVQLNILGGYMYQDTVNGCNGMMTAQTTADVQKQYLAGVQYLFDQGTAKLIETVEAVVRDVLGAASLKDSMTSADVDDLLHEVRRRIETRCDSGSATRRAGLYRFMLPDSDTAAQGDCCTVEEQITRRLTMETYDVVHSRDFETVLTACLDDGFRWLTNQIVEYFKPHASNGMTPATTTMPLAKVIPIVNGLIYAILADAPNPFVQELLLKDTVKDFAANVYDAFCKTQPAAGCGIN